MHVLITGGTGMLGRALLADEGANGHRVRVMSRSAGPLPNGERVVADLVTGSGLADAVRGVDVVIHAASDPRNADAVDVEADDPAALRAELVRQAERATGAPVD